MTEEEVHQKVADLFNENKLELRASRVIVPMDRLEAFVADPVLRFKILLDTLTFRKLLSSEIARGLKQSCIADNIEKFKTRHSITEEGMHTNLKMICTAVRTTIKISEIFDIYMYGFQNKEEYINKLSYFFKNMPFIGSLVKNSIALEFDETTHKHFIPFIETEMLHIKYKLDHIKIDYEK